MICSSCGTVVDKNIIFCPNCGASADNFISEPDVDLQSEKQNIVPEAPEMQMSEAPESTVHEETVPPSFIDENTVYNNNQIEQPVNQQFWVSPVFQPGFVQNLRDPGRDFAIASLVLGIVSYLLLCAFCFGWPSTFATTITGLVLGIKSRNKSKQAGFSNGMAAAGIVTNAVALALVSGICLMYLILFITGAEITSGEFMNELI